MPGRGPRARESDKARLAFSHKAGEDNQALATMNMTIGGFFLLSEPDDLGGHGHHSNDTMGDLPEHLFGAPNSLLSDSPDASSTMGAVAAAAAAAALAGGGDAGVEDEPLPLAGGGEAAPAAPPGGGEEEAGAGSD
eukprot:m.101470 g.101470  ORF g.101470 m.101470 type:complete len:136 (-) comp14090_c2_seq2:587-994(-)